MEQEIWENTQIEDILGEEWRDIAGYEGKYQVSNMGRVKSLNYNHTGKEKIRKLWKNRGEYIQVCLSKNGKKDPPEVQRLVAETFIPNPDNLPQVNHKDENKSNNRVENLEWISPKDNDNYGTRNERISAKLINNKKFSKPVICVETRTTYPSAMEASRQTGIHQGSISQCCQGKRKTAGGNHWQYAD